MRDGTKLEGFQVGGLGPLNERKARSISLENRSKARESAGKRISCRFAAQRPRLQANPHYCVSWRRGMFEEQGCGFNLTMPGLGLGKGRWLRMADHRWL